MARNLLNSLSPFTNFARSYKYMGPAPPGYVKYPGGIKYYPRYPDEKDPEITPSKLFRVERIKPLKGTPKKLRRILALLKIDEEDKRIAIVKNIPVMNASMWKIKHLVKISPIYFPYGEPTANDINHTVLRETGECIVAKELAVDPKMLEAREEFERNPWKIAGCNIEKDCRDKWMNPYKGGF